jgi:hypothetical protein
MSAYRHVAALHMHNGKYGHPVADHAASVTGTTGVFEKQRASRTKLVPLTVTGLELHVPRQHEGPHAQRRRLSVADPAARHSRSDPGIPVPHVPSERLGFLAFKPLLGRRGDASRLRPVDLGRMLLGILLRQELPEQF